ncbi:MAG: DUF4062 domain-containing protein [Planctomycetota bacterium]|nr:DUF4062 domain-containing protein [Planctomycetota bacterium]
MRSPIDVFISSTCYDLVDLRAELALHLKDNGFMVRISEDRDSAFRVDPTADTIGSCLSNISSSDIVVCIISQKYGSLLEHGDYQGKSAVHAEILHAWEHEKPVFFFVRNRALDEFYQLQRDAQYKTRWVEAHDDDEIERKQ